MSCLYSSDKQKLIQSICTKYIQVLLIHLCTNSNKDMCIWKSLAKIFLMKYPHNADQQQTKHKNIWLVDKLYLIGWDKLLTVSLALVLISYKFVDTAFYFLLSVPFGRINMMFLIKFFNIFVEHKAINFSKCVYFHCVVNYKPCGCMWFVF